MSNKKVLTSNDGCDCGCHGLGGISGFPPGSGSGDANIIVRNKPGIAIGNVIYEYHESGKTIYELDDLVLAPPAVSLINDAPVAEIGQTLLTVTFSGSIVQGTYPIVSRSIAPDPGGLDLTAPFTFQKLNVKRTTPGIAENHTLSATDNQGGIKSVSSGVSFKHSVYQGFDALTSLNEAQIKALSKTLNDSIIQKYGGEKTYINPPSTPKFIYWSGPVGTQSIAGAVLNGLALPLIDLTPVNVTNVNDGAIITSYWVKRTANLFDPGTYKIILS